MPEGKILFGFFVKDFVLFMWLKHWNRDHRVMLFFNSCYAQEGTTVTQFPNQSLRSVLRTVGEI